MNKSPFTIKNDKFVFFSFYYKEIDVGGDSIINVFDELNVFNNKEYKKATAFIRYPSWSLMNDIQNVCRIPNPFSNKIEVDPYKYRDMKIKRLLIKIENEDGKTYKTNDEFVDSMSPQLAIFLSEKIEAILSENYIDDGLSKEEGRELSLEVYKYLKAKKKRASGERVKIPPMPSIMLISHLCEKFGIVPDEARKISLRDIEMMNVVAEQEDVVNNPLKYGNGPKDYHTKMRGNR